MSSYETFELGEFGETELGEFGEYEFGETGETEYGEYEYGETEYESEQFLGGILGSVLGGELESPIGEVQEMELAAELLEIQSEEELEQFLGKVFKRVAGGVGKFMKSGVGRALGGALKSVAKTALPMVGGALGSLVAPGVGTALGSKLGSMAGGLLEVGELEMMGEEEAQFEAARRFVRVSADAARRASTAPPTAPPRVVARVAVTSAARRHAPGLLRGTPRRPVGSRGPARRPGRPIPSRRPWGGPPVAGRRPVPRPAGRPRAHDGYAGGAYVGGPGGYADDVWADGGDPWAQPAEPYSDGYAAGSGGRNSGRWFRRGNRIVIVGA